MKGSGDRHSDIDTTATHLLVPLHNQKYEHRTVLVVGLEERSVYHHDSYKRGSKAGRSWVADTVIPALEKWTCLELGADVKSGKCAEQEGVECGIHTIANALALLNAEDLPMKVNALETTIWIFMQDNYGLLEIRGTSIVESQTVLQIVKSLA